MNAPAFFEDSRFAGYVQSVLNLLPDSYGKEMEMRCRLLMARDAATVALQQCSEEAAPVLQHIERLVTFYAFAPLAADQLEALRTCLRRLIATAQMLDDFSASIAETAA